MEPKDPIVGRIIGANVAAWLGAGIGAAASPEFGGDAFSSIVASQNAMVGAFCGSLFGGGAGWLIDRNIGDGRRQRYGNPPPRLDSRPGPRPGEPGDTGRLPNRDAGPSPRPVEPSSAGGRPSPDNRPGPRPGEPGSAGRRNRENRPGSASDVTALHNGDNVSVSWTAGERAARYDVFYKTTNMQSWTIATSGHTGTAFVFTGADWGATYTFAVRALNSAGASDWALSAPASR